MVFQPTSIIATLTGELFAWLRCQHPALSLWTVAEQTTALTCHLGLYFGCPRPAIGQLDLTCSIDRDLLCHRLIVGQCSGTLSHHQFKPDLTLDALQSLLVQLLSVERCAVRLQTGLTSLGPRPCEFNEVTVCFEPLHYEFNPNEEDPDYQGFAATLGQDATTWIRLVSRLIVEGSGQYR
jgi:hypothetical protein